MNRIVSTIYFASLATAAPDCSWTQHRITAAQDNLNRSKSDAGTNQWWQQAAQDELDAANKAKSDCEGGNGPSGGTGTGSCSWTQYRLTAAEENLNRAKTGAGANQWWQQAAQNEFDAAKKAKENCEGIHGSTSSAASATASSPTSTHSTVSSALKVGAFGMSLLLLV